MAAGCGLRRRLKAVDVWARRCQSLQAFELYDRKFQTDGDEDGVMRILADRGLIDGGAAGDDLIRYRLRYFERPRRTDRGGAHATFVALEDDFHNASLFLEAQRVADGTAEDVVLLPKNIGGADIGMTGKGYFHRWR